MSDFKVAKCDRQKMLIHLELSARYTGCELEQQLGNGMLIIIPNHDFPNNLPNIESEENSLVFTDTDQNDSDFESPRSKRPCRERRTSLVASAGCSSDLSVDMSVTPSNPPIPRIASTSSSVATLIPELPEILLNDDWAYESLTTSQHIIFPTLADDADVQLVEIKRQNIIENMFALYKDENIVNHRLNVKFIDEEGIDGGGLTLELFTILWSEVFSIHSYFKGNDVLVPYVPLHKLRKLKPDFQILGRILGHMILLVGSFPNKLAVYTFTALSLKKEDYSQYKSILLQDFMLHVTVAERKLLKKALNSFNALSGTEIDRLTTLFSTNNLLDIPRQSEIEEQILTIAEKVIVKDTAELYAEMRLGLPTRILEFFNNVPLNDIVDIWNSQQPTAEKVMNILKLAVECPNNQQEKTFFFLQNYVGSLPIKQLSKFVLFVTASIHMPNDITVSFHDHIGLARRPIAHTCSNTIELGVTYESQQDFDSELELYLSDVHSYEYDQIFKKKL